MWLPESKWNSGRRENSLVSESSLAKYPFVPEASEYIGRLNIDIKDLATKEFEDVLDRAEERIREAMLSGTVERHSLRDRVEIASFPIAVMMVASSADS